MAARHVNGIDPEASRAIRNLILKNGDGEFSRPEYRVKVSWNTGYRTTSRVTDGQVVAGDEPPQYGGEGRGLTPQDLLLTAIGHCLAATYVGGLSAAGIGIRSLQLDVFGRVDFRAAFAPGPDHPGFDRIGVRVEIEADAPPEQLDALLERLLKTAPIPDTIMRPVPLDVDVVHR